MAGPAGPPGRGRGGRAGRMAGVRGRPAGRLGPRAAQPVRRVGDQVQPPGADVPAGLARARLRLRRAVLLPVRLRPVQLAPHRLRRHHRPSVPLHPDRLPGRSLAAVRRRPRPPPSGGAGGGQPAVRGGDGLARRGACPRWRPARAVGAAAGRLLRPGDQRRAGHLGAHRRRVPARRAARLPAGPLPAGGGTARVRGGEQRARPGGAGSAGRRPAVAAGPPPGQAGAARPGLAGAGPGLPRPAGDPAAGDTGRGGHRRRRGGQPDLAVQGPGAGRLPGHPPGQLQPAGPVRLQPDRVPRDHVVRGSGLRGAPGQRRPGARAARLRRLRAAGTGDRVGPVLGQRVRRRPHFRRRVRDGGGAAAGHPGTGRHPRAAGLAGRGGAGGPGNGCRPPRPGPVTCRR